MKQQEKKYILQNKLTKLYIRLDANSKIGFGFTRKRTQAHPFTNEAATQIIMDTADVTESSTFELYKAIAV